jgi:hypothetical protein
MSCVVKAFPCSHPASTAVKTCYKLFPRILFLHLTLLSKCCCLQRTPPWVLSKQELTPGWAVPAAQRGNKLTLWLQRAAIFWRQELLLGAALTKNTTMILRKVGGGEGVTSVHAWSSGGGGGGG